MTTIVARCARSGNAANTRFCIYLSTSSAQTVLRKGSLRRLTREVGHVHFFTRETALQALEDAGYEVLDARLTAPGIELSRASLAFNIAKVPRKIVRRIDDDFAARLLGGFSLLVVAR